MLFGAGNVIHSGRVASTGDEYRLVQVAGFKDAFDAGAIRHAGDVRCTQLQIHEAKKHAKLESAGAVVPKQTNGHSGIDENRSAKVAAFMCDPIVVEPMKASFANASKGVKWKLRRRRWGLWQRLCQEMEIERLKSVSWNYFSLLTGTKHYELLTADN